VRPARRRNRNRQPDEKTRPNVLLGTLGRRELSALEAAAAITQADVALANEDDVVECGRVEQSSCRDGLSRELETIGRLLWIAAGMVVHEDDARCLRRIADVNSSATRTTAALTLPSRRKRDFPLELVASPRNCR
jgi:hypothetical protein